MPSRKVKNPCNKCSFKNEVGSKFCNHCGSALPQVHVQEKEHVHAHTDASDAKAEHRDIAHPITQQFREYLQGKILEAYNKEARQK